MNSEFKRCIEKRKLSVFKPTLDIIKKEIEAAKYDLMRARDSLNDKDPKWATIQAYYAMFHAARALIYHKGYREKSHRCLLIALKELYVDRGYLASDVVLSFQEAMDLREHADYGFVYNRMSADAIIRKAEQFIEITQKLLKH